MSYFGIFGLSFLANVVVPVPEEVVILAIGYVIGTGHINFWITFAVVFFGALLSDVIMYYLSFHGNRLVRGVYDKLFSKILPMDDSFVQRHIAKIVFISRFLVNIRFIGPFFAGHVKMPIGTFMFWNSFALLIYTGVMLWAGSYFQDRLEGIFSGIGTFKNVMLILIGIVVIMTLGQIAKNAFLRFKNRGEGEKIEQ